MIISNSSGIKKYLPLNTSGLRRSRLRETVPAPDRNIREENLSEMMWKHDMNF